MQESVALAKRTAKRTVSKAVKTGKKLKGMPAKMKKTEGTVKLGLSSIQTLLESQPDLKASLQEVVEAEKRIYDAGSKQVKDLATYLKANWKFVVPALAALGVGAHLLGRSPKAKKLIKQ